MPNNTAEEVKSVRLYHLTQVAQISDNCHFVCTESNFTLKQVCDLLNRNSIKHIAHLTSYGLISVIVATTMIAVAVDSSDLIPRLFDGSYGSMKT